MSDTNNYIENLLLNLGALKSELNDTEPTMGTLTDAQREALVSLLDGLEYSLTSYGESDYGCCQDICETEICFDAPSGYNTPELLEKVSFLINMSNLGVANIPSNARFKEWYGSIDNNMLRAMVSEYVLPRVDWIFENILRLEKPSNENTQVLTYSLVASLLYVVFGDPVLMVKASQGLLEEDSVDKMLDSLVKDVFNLEHDNWQGLLASLNETLTKNLTDDQANDITITEENVYELVSWVLVNLQDGLNQTEDKDDCSSEFGVKFPSYPGVLWVLVNTILAVAGSFLISGARGKFGKKASGDLKWVPPFGPKDTDSSDFSHLFGDTRSPFSGFSVKNVHVENDGLGPIIVQFNEEVTNAEFDYNHASIGDANSYDVSLKRLDPESVTICNISVSAHPSKHDRVQLIIESANPVLFDGDYGQDYVLKIKIGADGMSDVYNDDADVDKVPAWTQNWASDGARREISIEGGSSGPTFSDFMRWAMDTGDGTFTDSINYLIDWHSRNLQPEFNDAYVALQSIGWMNRKGSDFAGFLHPDSMCGPYIEQLFADYFNTTEKECVKVKIEASCGVFKCDNLKWSAKCPDGDESIVTMLSRSTIGTNDAQEVGFLFAKTEEIVSHNPEGGVSLCVVDCAECGTQNCPPEMISQLEADITAATAELESLEASEEYQKAEVERIANNAEEQSSLLTEATNNISLLTAMATSYNETHDLWLAGKCDTTNSGSDSCLSLESTMATISSDILALGLGCTDEGGDLLVGQDGKIDITQCTALAATIKAQAEEALMSILAELDDAQKTLREIEEQISAVSGFIDAATQQLQDCNCEDCENGPWKIIRQGTDASEYSAECLVGWDYTDDGDIVVDESKPAHGAKTISLSAKPNTLMIDKSGDVYADGSKVARVALCGQTNTTFTSLFDPDLPLLMIHPKYVGDKRIFHLMQDGFAIVDDYPNSLRDELKRHEIIPYPIGRFFQGDPCDDSEPEECLEEWCCRNPDLPDCLDIGDCGGVTIPQWFRDWYEEHRDYLILKLPYDKRYIGDPLRYSYDEQILFAKALIDLVVRYFNSTPMTVSNGFINWSDMTRQLNVLPLLLKDRPSRTKFSFGDWMVGKNSNSPEVDYPATDEICVECCDDILNDECDVLDTFEDCCESSCGRWNQECSYLTGDIVTGLSGEHCYEALTDICAGDCNPEPGSAGSEDIWFRCTPDCETEVPPCDFTVSDNYLCAHEGCEALITVALQYNTQPTPNLCDYRWIFTARNVNIPDFPPISVESFGKTPTDPWSTVNLPIFPVNCDGTEDLGYYVGIDDTHLVSEEVLDPNVWNFTLQARSSISDDVLSECTSENVSFDVNCDFDVIIWDELDEAKANALGWCDEEGGDNPNGQRQGAPASELGDSIELLNQNLENIYAWRDSNDISGLSQQTFDELVSNCSSVLDSLMVATEMPDDFDYTILQEEIDTAVNTFVINDASAIDSAIAVCFSFRKSAIDIINAFGVYAGASECCCVVLTPTSEENVCDMSWVWTVDTGVGMPIPYYGGLGKLPNETVACAIRNPFNEENETQVSVRVYSYASTCDDYVQSAVNNWSGQAWSEYFDPTVICNCEREIIISCPCEPRGGIAELEMVGCDEQDDTKFIINLAHTNELNECEVAWKWQIQPASQGVIDIDGGTGTVALPVDGQILNAGTEHTIILVWQSLENPSVTGNVFTQTLTIPYCPRLDLNHNFNGNRFTETVYGDASVSDYTHGTVVPENNGVYDYNGDGTSTSYPPNQLSLSVTSTNNKGTFRISSNHEPDETDQQWLAVDDSKYTFKWLVESSNGGSFGVDEVALVKTSSYSVKGRVPSLDAEVPTELIGDGVTYSVTLMAIPKPETTVVSGAVQNSWFPNTKYRGARTFEFETVVPSHAGVESVSVLPSGNGEFTPTEKFHGTASQEMVFKGVATDGTVLSTGSFNMNFDVADDPCTILSTTVVEDSIQILNAPIVEAADAAGGAMVRVSFDAYWDLHEECGLSSNDVNEPNLYFRKRLLDATGAMLGYAVATPTSFTWDDAQRRITASFEEDIWMPTGAGLDPNVGGKITIGLKLAATDNDVAEASYEPTVGGVPGYIHWYDLGLPEYRECVNGQWIQSIGQEGDGQPTGCPCVIPQLQTAITWSGTNNNETVHVPQPSADYFVDIDLHEFLELEPNEWQNRDYEYTLISSNGDYNDFTAEVRNDLDTDPGRGRLRISSNDFVAKGFTKTIVSTIGAWNKERFQDYSAAVGEGCNVEFTISVELIAGCVTPNTVDYFAGANIQPINLDCAVAVPGCTDETAFNYNPQANVDDGSCVPVVEGCMDPEAENYNPAANTDDGSCDYISPSLLPGAGAIVDGIIDNGSGIATVSQGTNSITVSLDSDVFGSVSYSSVNSINLRNLINFSSATGTSSDYNITYTRADIPQNTNDSDTVQLNYGVGKKQELDLSTKSALEDDKVYEYELVKDTLVWNVNVKHNNFAQNGVEYNFTLTSVVAKQKMPCYVPEVKNKGAIGTGGIFKKVNDAFGVLPANDFNIANMNYAEVGSGNNHYVITLQDGFVKLSDGNKGKYSSSIVMNYADFFNDPVGAGGLSRTYSSTRKVLRPNGSEASALTLTSSSNGFRVDANLNTDATDLSLGAITVNGSVATSVPVQNKVVYEIKSSYSDCDAWDSETLTLEFVLENQTWTAGCTDNTKYGYNSDAVYDDGSCEDIIEGCADINACNTAVAGTFNTTNNALCVYPTCCWNQSDFKDGAGTIVFDGHDIGGGSLTDYWHYLLTTTTSNDSKIEVPASYARFDCEGQIQQTPSHGAYNSLVAGNPTGDAIWYLLNTGSGIISKVDKAAQVIVVNGKPYGEFAEVVKNDTDITAYLNGLIRQLVLIIDSGDVNCGIIKDDYNNLVDQFANRFYEVSMMRSAPCLHWATAARDAVIQSGWDEDDADTVINALQGVFDNGASISWAYGVGLNMGKWDLNRIKNWILSGVKETCDGTGCETISPDAPEAVEFDGHPPGHTIETPDGTTYTLNASGYVVATSVNQNWLISATTPLTVTWWNPEGS